MERTQKIRNLAINYRIFVSWFSVKVLLLHRDIPSSIDTLNELEAPWLPLELVFDNFSLLSSADVERILGAVRPATYLLDLCPSWLVKAGDERI